MCLFFLVRLGGPRIGILFWAIVEPNRWDTAFSSFFWPMMGFLFLPWTTLMFVAIAPFGNVAGWDWFWLALAVVADISTWSSSGYGNKDRVQTYVSY